MATQNIFNLTDTWNNVATTFTAIKMNATDTASAAGSMLIDLQVGGTTQFHVLKSGAVHTKRSNYNITNTNAASILVSNYSLTGSDATSMFDLAGTWNTSGTPTAIKLNMTDTASNAASALMDLQVGGVSQFKVSKAGAVTAVGVSIPTISSTSTLTNKTLSSPTVSGTIAGGATWTGAQTFESNSTTIKGDDGAIVFQEGGGVSRWLAGLRTTNIGNDEDFVFYSLSYGTALQLKYSTGVADFKVTPTLNGVAIPTISSTDTLSNKTLSSPTLSGTVAGTPAWSGRQDFGNEVTVTGANNQYAFGVRNRSTAGYFYQGATNSATPDYIFSRNAGDAVLTLGQDLSTTVAGGLVVGAPTGGNKGTGTANFAADIYKNNSAFTNPDYVFEHFYRGEIVEFAANDGASEYAGLMPLDALREFTRENLHLPQVPKSGGVGIFERGDYLLRAIEENTLYILALHEQIENLNQRLKELEK